MKSRAPSFNSSNNLTQTKCPVCRATNLGSCPPGKDRLFGIAPGSFALLRCEACGCVFQDPLPKVSILEKFYPQEYWWSENSQKTSESGRLFRKLEKAYREFVIRDHVRFLERCERTGAGNEKLLLDIGCGNGTFLNAARSRGFRPHGMDVSARAVEIASAQYGLPVRQGAIGSSCWSDCRFDFITMFHVLEHLPDPRFALEYARGLLRPGGALIIQVPNVSSVQARILGRWWYGLDVPRHVINFSPKSLSLLLEETGFEFRIVSRFSLRDNPASIASSLVPWFDPIGRKGRGADSKPVMSGLIEIAYFGLFLLALPPAYLESCIGLGGTLWACARPK